MLRERLCCCYCKGDVENLEAPLDLNVKHLDAVDGELAAVPVEERPAAGTIGQNLELVILKLRSADAEVWTACTVTAVEV